MKPRKTARTISENMERPQDDEDCAEEPLMEGADLCQQLLDRYSASSAPQHRHLVATAAATRAILAAESLPLSPSSYFAAAMSMLDSAETLSSTELAAIMSFLVIVLPVVPPSGIASPKARQAVEVLARIIGKEDEEKLGASSVRSAVKCLGILIGFCDLEDWDSVKLGFETLLKFSVDKRPKVRRCAQECFEKVFNLSQSPNLKRNASRLVLSSFENYIPLAVKLSSSRPADESDHEKLSIPENVEVLHMLNVVRLIFPCLSDKVSSKIREQIYGLMNSQFSTLTRHILKTIEASFEISKVGGSIPETEQIIIALSSYMSSNGNPVDTVISAACVLRAALYKLQNQGNDSWIKSLPMIVHSVTGLLTSESDTASQASGVLRELINHYVDEKTFSVGSQLVEDDCPMSAESSAMKAICSDFENSLDISEGIPTEDVIAVISVLFLRLGDSSYIYMKNILLKLAELMKHGSGDFGNDHLRRCIGSAVIAMGPERMLTLLPISVDPVELSYSNIWLLPILGDYVVGSSLEYYMEHIVPLAKSFQIASRKAGKSSLKKELQTHAHDLWKLLPSFCRHPTDTSKQFERLADLLIAVLKKYSFMQESAALGLQVLVNQNKTVLGSKSSAEFIASLKEPIQLQNVCHYSMKTAMRNLKAFAKGSTGLLQILADLFINSVPGRTSHLKDAIGCLASVSDSSVAKEILVSFLQRFNFLSSGGESQGSKNDMDASVDEKQETMTTSPSDKDVKRCAVMELASSLVEGAKEDLINLIFDFVKYTLKETNNVSHCEAYCTLSRILEEQAWFCSPRYMELIDLLIGLKTPIDTATLRNRFDCFRILVVHILKTSSEEEKENAKAFLILNEIIITSKDSKEETRKAASDVLLSISSSLRNDSDDSDSLHQKLISMIMGYLSGSSPHIMSGAVSALSVLLYKDPGACLSTPDLVPSILSLLQSKAVEVIKAGLGFVKVLVSCLPASDLQTLLHEVVQGIIPLSSVSRHHFRLKVTVILEIIVRKCGRAAVESIIPDKYEGFLRTVLEHRHNRASKQPGSADAPADLHANRSQKRKRKELGDSGKVEAWVKPKRGKWDKKNETASGPRLKRQFRVNGIRAGAGNGVKPSNGHQFNERKNKRKFDGTSNGQNRKEGNKGSTRKPKGAVKGSWTTASKSNKSKKFGGKRQEK